MVVNKPDNELHTLLHYAACHNQVEAINCLIELGANKNAQDKLGKTPLHYVYQAGALYALVKGGASI